MSQEITLKEALKEVDERAEELQKKLQMAEDVRELEKDERFQRVILQGYLSDEADRLFGVLVEPSTLKRDVMENIQDKLSSIRNLKQYFGVLGQNADMAPDQIEENEAYRKEVTAYFSKKPTETPEA